MVLLVEAAFAHSIKEICGYVEGLQFGESGLLEGLADDTGARTDVEADGGPREGEASLGLG